MKPQTRFGITVLFLLPFFLSSCKAQATPVYITGDELDQVSVAAEPLAAGILGGIRNNDYQLFTTAFDDTMLKAMTESQFSNIVKMYGKLGKAESVELINIEDRDAYYGANYKVTYPDQVVIMLLVLTKNAPYQVSGLWFK